MDSIQVLMLCPQRCPLILIRSSIRLTEALQLGMDVTSVYTDAKDPNPVPLQFDHRMFRGASRWG